MRLALHPHQVMAVAEEEVAIPIPLVLHGLAVPVPKG
jgi:hypothetical protein